MVELGDEDFGCLWAPDVIYDKENEDYVIQENIKELKPLMLK